METKEKQKCIDKIKEILKKLEFDEFKINSMIEEILKQQRNILFNFYNEYNLDVDRDDFKVNAEFQQLKSLEDIEEEIRDYFSKFDISNKIDELVNKINLFSYDKFEAPKSKKEFFDDDSIQLIEFNKGEITFRIFWRELKDYGNGKEYMLQTNFTEIEKLFKLVIDVDIKFNTGNGFNPFSKFPISDWQESNEFKYKGYLNGKFKVQGDEKYLKPIKDLFKEKYKKYNHFKIIEN